MEHTIREQLALINQHYKELDAIYHNAAVSSGLSDCMFWLLYVLYQAEQPYSQYELCSEWFYPKQTIHSAIQKMAQMGYVRLEPAAGSRRQKQVLLTEAGIAQCEKTVRPLLDAELSSFARLTDAERQTYLDLSAKYLSLFREEIQKL